MPRGTTTCRAPQCSAVPCSADEFTIQFRAVRRRDERSQASPCDAVAYKSCPCLARPCLAVHRNAERCESSRVLFLLLLGCSTGRPRLSELTALLSPVHACGVLLVHTVDVLPRLIPAASSSWQSISLLSVRHRALPYQAAPCVAQPRCDESFRAMPIHTMQRRAVPSTAKRCCSMSPVVAVPCANPT